ncbi:D-alanyl-D-alanine carboxypeptidase family protein [Patescibacteria group bacterium]|nr:D-alanyl-D-alanine carboxypeptidase family protein [Patescibacteria group bacterium]
MKKYFLAIFFGVLAIFALCYLIFPSVRNFIASQFASVIDFNKITEWQLEGGLQSDLAVGDKGKDIRLLQYALTRTSVGFKVEDINGIFDQKTSDALSSFQKKRGLEETGVLDTDTREAINRIYFKVLCPRGNSGDFTDELMIHVNKEKSLPDDYIPENLVDVSNVANAMGVVCVKEDLLSPLEQLFTDSLKENVKLGVTSGFRRPEIQSSIYTAWVALRGEKEKNRVAEPLHSEHQLGTALDFTGASINNLSANNRFEGTKEELWLRKNAYKYGFALSYPKDKTPLTGYDYEPWHYRYVGIDIAKEIFSKQISVEEYFDSIEK